jgi:hypothetical protein
MLGLSFVAAFALLAPHTASAEEGSAGTEEASAGAEEATEETPDTESEGIESTLDTSQERMSSFLEEILTRADSLLSGNRCYDAPTGSYLGLGSILTLRKAQDGGVELGALTRAKIDLPYTRERFKLLIDRDLENVTKSESQRDAQVAAGQIPVDDNPYMALRGIARETLKVTYAADAGARLRPVPDPFVRLRLSRLFSLGAWKIPLAETLLYRFDEKFSAASELAFLRSARENIAIGIVFNATYRDLTGGFDLGATVGVGWRINERSLLATEIGAYGQTEPDLRDTAYTVSLRYRRRIYKDWLLLELRPQVIFLPEQDFHAAPAFTVQFEMYFGSNYFQNL